MAIPLDELPAGVRSSLLRGYLEGAWKFAPFQPDDFPDLAAAEVTDQGAYDLGYELRSAAHMVWSADGSGDYERDCERYNAAAALLNERYGDGIALLMTDDGAPFILGLRGFRIVWWTSETITRRRAENGVEVEHSVEHVDMLAAARAADAEDRRRFDA